MVCGRTVCSNFSLQPKTKDLQQQVLRHLTWQQEEFNILKMLSRNINKSYIDMHLKAKKTLFDMKSNVPVLQSLGPVCTA